MGVGLAGASHRPLHLSHNDDPRLGYRPPPPVFRTGGESVSSPTSPGIPGNVGLGFFERNPGERQGPLRRERRLQAVQSTLYRFHQRMQEAAPDQSTGT